MKIEIERAGGKASVVCTDATNEEQVINLFEKAGGGISLAVDVQNIDLMNLSGFCRNCLAKWYSAEAVKLGEDLTVDSAKEIVYGMTYGEWKENYQK